MAALVALVAICPMTFAKGSHSWDNVQRLKHGAKIAVTLWADNPVEGRLEFATPAYLRISIGDSRRGASVRQIARERIWSVTYIKGPRLRDPDPLIRNGALIGGAAGLGIGIVRDVRSEPGAGANWFLDAFAGAGLGFLGGCMAAEGKGIVGLFRHDKLIYINERPLSSFPELSPPRAEQNPSLGFSPVVDRPQNLPGLAAVQRPLP
jgi:hypothetical protein